MLDPSTRRKPLRGDDGRADECQRELPHRSRRCVRPQRTGRSVSGCGQGALRGRRAGQSQRTRLQQPFARQRRCGRRGDRRLSRFGLRGARRAASRNVELSTGARIVAKPQLEIYADDVKCTHGATVGQMDDEAILYMRQRGLSEQQARRLQMEGFVAAIAAHCAVEPLCEELYRRIVTKLERM